MRFFKKIFGYSIGFICDKDFPPIESNIQVTKVYLNLSRLCEWNYYDFIFCIFRLFNDGPLLRINAAISAGKRLDALKNIIKCVFLYGLAGMCLCFRGVPLDLLALCFAFSGLWVCRKIVN